MESSTGPTPPLIAATEVKSPFSLRQPSRPGPTSVRANALASLAR